MGLPKDFYEKMNQIDKDRLKFQATLNAKIEDCIYANFEELENAPDLIIDAITNLINSFSMEVWSSCETASYKVETYNSFKLNEELTALNKLNWGFPRNTNHQVNHPQDKTYYEVLLNDLHHERFFDEIYQTTIEVIEATEKKSFRISPEEIVLLMRYLLMNCHSFTGSFYEEANPYLRDPFFTIEQ